MSKLRSENIIEPIIYFSPALLPIVLGGFVVCKRAGPQRTCSEYKSVSFTASFFLSRQISKLPVKQKRKKEEERSAKTSPLTYFKTLETFQLQAGTPVCGSGFFVFFWNVFC